MESGGATPDDDRARSTRRRFLAGAGTVTAAAAAGLHVASRDGDEATVPSDTAAVDFPPLPPASLPPRDAVTEFFTRDEARTVEAIAARIVPGTPEDPGAREAGVARYIDHKLASFEAFAEPTYRHGPFPRLDATLHLSGDEADRYGFQSSLTPQQIYRRGLEALGRYTRQRFRAPFADLDEARQDTVLAALEDGRAGTFDEPPSDAFFEIVRTDVVHGMFADPAYGGNVGMVGWRLIGYPGAQRGYTPEELRSGRTDRRPQSLDHLPQVAPGVPTAGGEIEVQLPEHGVHQ